MTDGEQRCNGNHPNDGSDIDDTSVIDRIIRTKVRIITVAIGLVFSILIYCLM
jgi:hypothetical protein